MTAVLSWSVLLESTSDAVFELTISPAAFAELPPIVTLLKLAVPSLNRPPPRFMAELPLKVTSVRVAVPELVMPPPPLAVLLASITLLNVKVFLAWTSRPPPLVVVVRPPGTP